MEMIEIAGYLPDTAKDVLHKTAVSMQQVVQALVDGNDGKLVSFEVSKPGTALLFVLGDQAKQEIIREFKRLENVLVSEVPTLIVHQARNQKVQAKADRMRAARKKK